MPRWPVITAPRSWRRGRGGQRTRPRLRSPSRSPSAGSWPACATSASFPWRSSMRPSAASSSNFNARQMRGFGSSRTELFAEIDRPKLGELPDQPYVFARSKRCRVAPDYHVEIDGHWYSTPYRLIRELPDVRIADQTVEIFHTRQRLASHA